MEKARIEPALSKTSISVRYTTISASSLFSSPGEIRTHTLTVLSRLPHAFGLPDHFWVSLSTYPIYITCYSLASFFSSFFIWFLVIQLRIWGVITTILTQNKPYIIKNNVINISYQYMNGIENEKRTILLNHNTIFHSYLLLPKIF